MVKSIMLILFLLSASIAVAQPTIVEEDPCGAYIPDFMNSLLKAGYGYSYADLQNDIDTWQKDEFVKIDSIGASVQNRTIYMLSITDSKTNEKEFRIWIHARTHPNEVQSTFVTNEIIEYLLSDDEYITTLREKCIINIVPMINPDGVELGYGRENANQVNIESNWSSASPEIEVQVLKRVLDSLMKTSTPIDIALNMHSASNCKRYFVYHAEAGTSAKYVDMQKKFINHVKSEWTNGIEDWNYFVSWTSTTPTQYPESWFWLNHAEKVLALTYEDMNCAEAKDFDMTAQVIVNGIGRYFELLPPYIISSNFEKTEIPYKITTNGSLLTINGNGKVVSTELYTTQGIRVDSKKGEYLEFTINRKGLYILNINVENSASQVKIIIR
ncbi:MAG: hypothetical protein IPO21_21480 [Bacteroidales bacterium]|nr:hypothetical protein [Bacteroidales bacterium]